jgi:hypothetical protein
MSKRLAAVGPATDVSEQTWLKVMQEALERTQDLAVLRKRAMRRTPRLAPADYEVSSEPMLSLVKDFEAERAECVRKSCRRASAAAPGSERSLEVGRATLRSRGA